MDDLLPRERQYASHEHEYDGRPVVGWHDDDPLLARLIRFHPEIIPLELMKQLATKPGAI